MAKMRSLVGETSSFPHHMWLKWCQGLPATSTTLLPFLYPKTPTFWTLVPPGNPPDLPMSLPFPFNTCIAAHIPPLWSSCSSLFFFLCPSVDRPGWFLSLLMYIDIIPVSWPYSCVCEEGISVGFHGVLFFPCQPLGLRALQCTNLHYCKALLCAVPKQPKGQLETESWGFHWFILFGRYIVNNVFNKCLKYITMLFVCISVCINMI